MYEDDNLSLTSVDDNKSSSKSSCGCGQHRRACVVSLLALVLMVIGGLAILYGYMIPELKQFLSSNSDQHGNETGLVNSNSTLQYSPNGSAHVGPSEVTVEEIYGPAAKRSSEKLKRVDTGSPFYHDVFVMSGIVLLSIGCVCISLGVCYPLIRQVEKKSRAPIKKQSSIESPILVDYELPSYQPIFEFVQQECEQPTESIYTNPQQQNGVGGGGAPRPNQNGKPRPFVSGEMPMDKTTHYIQEY